jgi:hypothetical protein
MATVSFIRTVAIRAVFLRRMSPTFIATSFWSAAEYQREKFGIHYANSQFEIWVLRHAKKRQQH